MKKETAQKMSEYAQTAPTPAKRDLTNCWEFWHRTERNIDGTPLRAKRTGVTKTWKTHPDDFRIPVKYGIRTNFYITPQNLNEWVISKIGDFK